MIEDLAKVNHIFCDKTGTLTKNQLIFKAMGFNDKTFQIDDETPSALKTFTDQVKNFKDNTDAEGKEKFLDFWRCICICHEVIQYKEL